MSIWESIVGTFECCEPSKVSRGNNRFGEVSGDCCAPTRSLIGNDAEARKPIHSRLQALTQSRPSFHDARHLTAATDLYEGMPVQHLIEVQVIQTHTSFIVTVGSELYDAFDRKDCLACAIANHQLWWLVCWDICHKPRTELAVSHTPEFHPRDTESFFHMM